MYFRPGSRGSGVLCFSCVTERAPRHRFCVTCTWGRWRPPAPCTASFPLPPAPVSWEVQRRREYRSRRLTPGCASIGQLAPAGLFPVRVLGARLLILSPLVALLPQGEPPLLRSCSCMCCYQRTRVGFSYRRVTLHCRRHLSWRSLTSSPRRLRVL